MDCSTQASLSITNSWSLLKLTSIESVMPSNHLILCHPLLLLPSVFVSLRVFSSESVLCIRWPKYWNVSFSISPSSEYSGLISFRMDWLDLLAVQGTLKSLLQHHSSKASILWCSAFFMVQLSVSQSVQLLSCVQLFATPWTAGCPALISIHTSLEADIISLDEVTFEEGQPEKEGKKLDSCWCLWAAESTWGLSFQWTLFYVT